MKKHCPITPFILAFVLGPTMEQNFRNAISYSRGDMLSFFKRPASCILLIVAVLSVVLPLIRDHYKQRKTVKNKEA